MRLCNPNDIDGFMLTVVQPKYTGLLMHFIFNCYGMSGFNTDKKPIPKKYKEMLVEVAKTDESIRDQCNRFNWEELVPVEVSESPKILLSEKKLEYARSLFSQQEWDDVFCFIKQNISAIQRHWSGETGSMRLMEELRNVSGELLFHPNSMDG